MFREYLIPFIISNVFAILMVFAGWHRPRAARYIWAFVFTIASATNFIIATNYPWSYVTRYAPTAVFGFLRVFIEGWFSDHAQWVVMFIAFLQLLISAGLILGGFPRRIAIGAGIVFLISIAPLGFGSAFPAPLIMAAALGILAIRTSRKAFLPG